MPSKLDTDLCPALCMTETCFSKPLQADLFDAIRGRAQQHLVCLMIVAYRSSEDLADALLAVQAASSSGLLEAFASPSEHWRNIRYCCIFCIGNFYLCAVSVVTCLKTPTLPFLWHPARLWSARIHHPHAGVRGTDGTSLYVFLRGGIKGSSASPHHA